MTLEKLGYDMTEHSFDVFVYSKPHVGGQKTITFTWGEVYVETSELTPLNKVEVNPAGLDMEELEAVYQEFKKYIGGDI